MRILIVSFFFLFLLSVPFVSSTLSCSVKTACGSGEADLMHMYDRNNSHAELSTESSYNYKVCCGGSWENLGTACGTVLARLQSKTNSHVEKSDENNYGYEVCMSIANGNLECSYVTTSPGTDGFSDCLALGSDYTCIVTLSDNTNAHVADCTSGNSYGIKICCRSAETTPPSASIIINNGNSYTSSPDVTLSLTYSDSQSGIDKCSYMNDGESWSSWEDCQATKSWTLRQEDGSRTVYYRVRDLAGNINNSEYDSIFLDTTPPTSNVDALPAWMNSSVFNVSWQGDDSGGSGVKCFDVQWCDSTKDCSQDSEWKYIEYNPGSYTDCTSLRYADFNQYSTDVTTGVTYYFRSRARDNLDNLGSYPPAPGSETETTADLAADDPPQILATGAYDQYGRPLDGVISQKDITTVTLFSNTTDFVSGIEHNIIHYWITTDTENYYIYDCGSANPWGGYSNCTVDIPYTEDMLIQYQVEVVDRAGNHMFSDYFYIVSHRLANFVGSAVYTDIGKDALAKIQVRNLNEFRDTIYLNLTDYPLARFENSTDADNISADGRHMNVTLDKKQNTVFFVRIPSTDLGDYRLTLNAVSLTDNNVSDSDQITITIGTPASFPGLSDWAAMLMVSLAAVVVFMLSGRSAGKKYG